LYIFRSIASVGFVCDARMFAVLIPGLSFVMQSNCELKICPSGP